MFLASESVHLLKLAGAAFLHAYECTHIHTYRMGKAMEKIQCQRLLLSGSKSGSDLRNSAWPPFPIVWVPVKSYFLLVLPPVQSLFDLFILSSASSKGIKTTK